MTWLWRHVVLQVGQVNQYRSILPRGALVPAVMTLVIVSREMKTWFWVQHRLQRALAMMASAGVGIPGGPATGGTPVLLWSADMTKSEQISFFIFQSSTVVT